MAVLTDLIGVHCCQQMGQISTALMCASVQTPVSCSAEIQMACLWAVQCCCGHFGGVILLILSSSSASISSSISYAIIVDLHAIMQAYSIFSIFQRQAATNLRSFGRWQPSRRSVDVAVVSTVSSVSGGQYSSGGSRGGGGRGGGGRQLRWPLVHYSSGYDKPLEYHMPLSYAGGGTSVELLYCTLGATLG